MQRKLLVAAQFLATCKRRIQEGEAKYGPVRSDPRIRACEAQEESYDIQNYIEDILLAKHPELAHHPARLECVALNFKLFLALKELEKVERTLKGG